MADLTKRQRELEQNMFKKAEERNLARSAEEQSKNLCHKVLGRRGERVIRVVEMREEEMINEEGKVVLKEERNREDTHPRDQERNKRGRSPGSTPPARRTVRVGGRFGRGQ